MQLQEILRLVADGLTAQQIASPALNPFLRPIVRGKLAPSPYCTADAGIEPAGLGVAAAAGSMGAESVAAVDEGAAIDKNAAHAATAKPRAAGMTINTAASDGACAIGKAAAAASSMHGHHAGIAPPCDGFHTPYLCRMRLRPPVSCPHQLQVRCLHPANT